MKVYNQKAEAERIDKVVRYIWEHLDQDLKLDELAAKALYSSYHFHRIFKSVTRETPNKYITRLRMESAAHTIILNPEKPILNVAIDIGYQSLESFSRAFKAYYAISPQQFKTIEQSRKLTIIQKRNFNSFIPNIVQASDDNNTDVEIIKLPTQELITFHTNIASAEKITDEFCDITRWASARELVYEGQYPFGILHDFPLFTTLDKCRFLICLPILHKDSVTNPMHYLEIPPRKYAKFICSGGIDNIIGTMIHIVHKRLPETGHKVVNEMTMIIPEKDPGKIAFDKNTYQILMPIIPA